MNKFKIVYKLIFHFLNVFIIILSLYPGSLLGCYLFNDCSYDPQIAEEFIASSVSTNHLYAFGILTLFGILAYNKKSKINFLFIYLIFISIILELVHIFIPVRVFQIEDLLGNFIGVILIISIYFIKNEYF